MKGFFKSLATSLLLAGVPLAGQHPGVQHPGIQHPVDSDPCSGIENFEAAAACYANSGGSGSADCKCPNGTKCDVSITTATGDMLSNTGCVFGSFAIYSGLKCFYWNSKTNQNEIRIIKC